MKLWQKGKDLPAGQAGADDAVSKFTTGNDPHLDLQLARFDILGSLAHVAMLGSIGILARDEVGKLSAELKKIHPEIKSGSFQITKGVEDIHSQVELLLTDRLGEMGKKIHSGRSRNDQVLVDIRLFLRYELGQIVTLVKSLFDLLIAKSDEHRDKLLPGYTHLQLAMPSSFGLWFGAYAESLIDDLVTVSAAYQVVNKNPLGSAAGYGSSFPLDRKMTTELLGFAELNYNVVYAQMGRGKTERIVAAALSNVAATLSKLSMDACLFMNQNFGFISFPDELTTGSSIMPHKKNPDVFELIRARCNQMMALPGDIAMLTANLPSGYHRDFQLLKEMLFPALANIKDCLQMTGMMLERVQVKDHLLDDEKYKYLFSVEEVNKLVFGGMPFRDAYKKVGLDIEAGKYTPARSISHTHEGSIGNLSLEAVRQMMVRVIAGFPLEKVAAAESSLLK